MKLAIMQPYLFPYIGYYQLINAVDVFVLYDDVTWIKQGWINRNRIIVNQKEFMFTLQVKGASSNKLIKDVKLGANKNKVLKTITQAYKKAPFFDNYYKSIETIFNYKSEYLIDFLYNSFYEVLKLLGINTNLLLSSNIDKNNELKSQEKVIDVCKILKAQNYINSIGGYDLYSKQIFKENGVELKFLRTDEIIYPQLSSSFIPNLSIIDVIMNNSIEQIQKYLNQYSLV